MEPPTKRQRPLTKACEACKARKAKCDSETPCCGRCRKKGTECVYREREQPGLRAGYGKNLDERLSRMEDGLQRIQRMLVEQPSLSLSRPQQTGLNNGVSVEVLPEPNRHPLPQDGPLQDDTPPQFHESSITAVSPSNIGDLYMIDPQQQQQHHHHHIADGLPPRYVVHNLVALYFEFANSGINILERQQFEADMLKPDRISVLYGVVLVALRYWDQQPPDPILRQQYADNCREKILSLAMETISLPSAQALALLAFDALGQGPSARTLNVMALLNTAVSQLDLAQEKGDNKSDNRFNINATRLVRKQLHESQQENEAASLDDSEERWRLFWTVYVLDRVVSVSHGVECRMTPNFFRRTVEAGVDEIPTAQGRLDALRLDVELRSAKAGLSDSWKLLVQVATLMERVNEFILKPVDLCDAIQCREWKRHFRALDAALCAWKETLPLPNRSSPFSDGFDAVWATAIATYHTAVIRMQSVAAFPPRICHYFTPSPNAPGRCHEAVNEISALCRSIAPHNIPKLGPLFVFGVWVAARSMTALWTTGWEERSPTAPPELTVLRNILREMSRYWQCAQNYSSMIDFAVDSDDGANEQEQSVLAVFNDVSKTAYGLHNVLEPRLRQGIESQLAQLWDWVDIPGVSV